MGSRIAVLLARAGLHVTLLDLSADLAVAGVNRATKGGGCPEMDTGSFDLDLAKLEGCDWILEAVSEDLEVKRSLWGRVDQVRRAGTVLSSNTSGLPLHSIASGMSAGFQGYFLGTHFFNPPHALKLLELTPCEKTDPDVLAAMHDLCSGLLGREVVRCKDTPNFIANRLGSFYGSTAMRLAGELNLSVEEVDGITGPLIGMPVTATYGLIDLIGLDVWAAMTANVGLPAPQYLVHLIANGRLGRKTGAGFYDGESIFDLNALEYRPRQAMTPDSALCIENLPDRLRVLSARTDKSGRFLRALWDAYLRYASKHASEIADCPTDIDRAMRFGYAHPYGPFELRQILEGRCE